MEQTRFIEQLELQTNGRIARIDLLAPGLKIYNLILVEWVFESMRPFLIVLGMCYLILSCNL